VTTGITCWIVTLPAFAAEPEMRIETPPSSTDVFRAQETSIDLFGSGSVGEETLNHISRERVEQDGRLGAGLGLNYFFNRYFGIGGEGYTEDAGHAFIDNADGSLIFRIPIDEIRLAPCLFVGGGYQFDPIEQGFAHGGVGLEFRFTQRVGL